jgi:hypothetical protein
MRPLTTSKVVPTLRGGYPVKARWAGQALLRDAAGVGRTNVAMRRTSADTRGPSHALQAIALGCAVFLTYVGLTATVMTQLLQSRSEGAAVHDTLGSRPLTGTPLVLTIRVDGPNASTVVYCDTTTDRVEFDEVHVTPGDVVDAYNQLCDAPGGE